MSVDIVKQLDKAKRFMEKNRLEDAVEAYQQILAAVPNHLESIQSLGDLLTMQNRPDKAAQYYGMLFDRFTGPRDDAKALALYTRFLKLQQQPPERVARYALLLQKQNRTDEAIEQFTAAALAFELGGKGEDALSCFVRISQLDPDTRDRHVAVAELAERLGNQAAAARGYLRAGQLTPENEDEALEFFAKANSLIPYDRSAALLYAQALLHKGDPAAAAALLQNLSETERDATFLETYADALMKSGKLDDSRAVLERMTNQGAGSAEKLFALATEYLKSGQEDKAVDLLSGMKKSMMAARRETEFASSIEQLSGSFPDSLLIAEFQAAFYSEINRETLYFDALARLFDLYRAKNQLAGACDALEKLVEIDPYDSRNQQRLDLLKGRAEDQFLTRVRSRMANAATHRGDTPTIRAPERRKVDEHSHAILADVDTAQTLEDLLVQAEIFVQYSLQSKAIERLQRIVELFPSEAEHNERLRGLFEGAHWWPDETLMARKTSEKPRTSADEPANRAASPFGPETLRDLAKISEINQNIFRQPSPRAMLSVAVNEAGNYLKASRCLAIIGTPGQPPQMASEFCTSGFEVSTGSQIVRLMNQVERAAPDSLGGLQFDSVSTPILKEMGLETALGVQLKDPESQSPAGMLIAGFTGPHNWKQNETYFLQSIGDQMLMCVHHTRLRTLVRTLAVADEKTGLLARGSYIDCLLHESQRARAQGVPLTLALLQVDGGPELLRQQGDAPFERYMEQLGKAVHAIVRQSDLAIKYTSWALAIVLPDTPLAGAQILADKLKRAASGLRPPWDGGHLTASVSVAEAIARQDYENEDVVTELINRVEAGLEEARKRGGNEIVAYEMAKN